MKKISIVLLVSAMTICLLACGNEADIENTEVMDTTTSGSIVQVEIEEVDDSGVEEKEIIKKDRKSIKVAVVGSPATDILKYADQAMEYTDYCIEQVVCNDFSKPNELVVNEEAVASLCLNQVLLESYNKINESDLTIVERIYIDPLAIFPGKIVDLNNISSGETIAVVEGDVNVARALYLLEQKGIVELKAGALYQATMEDVVTNPYNIKIEQIEIKDSWPDTSKYGMIISDYNRAIINGIDPTTAIGEENRNSQLFDMFAVSLVVKKENVDDKKVATLLKAINSDEVEQQIKENFYHAVLDYK